MDQMKESIKNGLSFVGDTVSEIAAAIAEKNRLRVQLNHIKGLIKADSATRDQAYIELGRFFYENMREGASPENEAICAVIDAASERISRASIKYMELLNLQNETHIRSENAEKLKKVVSQKAASSAKVAKEKGAELAGKAKEAAQGAVEKAKELTAQGAAKAKEAAERAAEKAKGTAADLKDKAEEAVEDVKERFSPAANAERCKRPLNRRRLPNRLRTPRLRKRLSRYPTTRNRPSRSRSDSCIPLFCCQKELSARTALFYFAVRDFLCCAGTRFSCADCMNKRAGFWIARRSVLW